MGRTKKYQSIRQRYLLLKYGITLEQYSVMLAEQEGKCALCLNFPKKNKLAVDHNHLTGRNRGLLCVRCNVILGQVEQNPELFHRMFQYLNKWKV